MRALGVIAALTILVSMSTPAAAGLGKKCRKACKPFVAECHLGGQPRRACKKTYVRGCKREGLQVCAVTATTTTTTTTTPTTPGNSTSTSTLIPGGEAGAINVDVIEVARDGDTDPRLFTLTITILYPLSSTGASAGVPVGPSAFTVVDQDTNVVYTAEPTQGPQDCSQDDIITKGGPPITCMLRFRLPASVGDLSPMSGVHARLQFSEYGIRGSDLWSYLSA